MRIYLSDWLTNAGIVGFLRIQAERGIKYDISRNFLEITSADLKGFADAYFTYVLVENMGTLYPNDIFNKLSGKSGVLNQEQYSKLQEEIQKIQLTSMEKFKPDWRSFDNTINRLEKIMAQTSKRIIRKISEILAKAEGKQTKATIKAIQKKMQERVKKLTHRKGNYVYSQLQRFYFNKAVIGNPSASGNRIDSFQQIYVDPAQKLLEAHSVDGLTCKFCKENKVAITDFLGQGTFFNEGMFSTIGVSLDKFLNFYYNYQPDLVVCDVCELMLLCAFAGFNKIPPRFRDDVNDTNHIFVNLPSLELLFEENNRLRDIYMQSKEDVQETIYEDIIEDLFVKEKKKKSIWVIENVLFIEINPTGRKDIAKPNLVYFHIGKDIAELFIDESAISSFKKIKGTINAGNIRLALKREVIRRILSRDSLYPLCFYLIKEYIKEPNFLHLRNVFNIAMLSALRSIIWATEGSGKMLESRQIFGILKQFQECGREFTKNMELEQRQQKSHRLLSLIRTGKIADFYDTLVKMYIAENRPVPDIMISLLNEEDQIDFHVKAYAFMSGFLGETVNPKVGKFA